MEKIRVSACLLNEAKTYNGGSNHIEELLGLAEFYELVPFCPEIEGGLTVPRLPSEIKGDRVIDKEGKSVTKEFRLGAEKAVNLANYLNIKLAILEENSPSCGVHFVHDGNFSGKLVPGKGVTTSSLLLKGVEVLNETEGLALLHRLQEQQASKEAKRAQLKLEEERKAKKEEEKKRPKFHKQKDYGVRKPVTFDRTRRKRIRKKED